MSPPPFTWSRFGLIPGGFDPSVGVLARCQELLLPGPRAALSPMRPRPAGGARVSVSGLRGVDGGPPWERHRLFGLAGQEN